MRLEKKIRHYIEKFHLLPIGSGVVIGLSGGADSVALLEVLCSLQWERDLRLAAVHVHHGIRESAQKDVEFCRELCMEKKVDFFCEYIDVPRMAKAQGLSEEEAGRNARYRIFEEYRRKLQMDVIAVAHHQNDQAETILFQLFRGSGLRGMSGMQPKRGNIIRPLLGVSRKEIEEYLCDKQRTYVIDETNACDQYSRNKIRHHVLPVAEEISFGAAGHMSQTAGQLGEVLDYMEHQAANFLDMQGEYVDGEWRLPVEALQQEHIALQKMIVTEALARSFKSRKDITEKHIDHVLQLFDKDGEKTIHLPNGGVVVKRYFQLIFKQIIENNESDFSGFCKIKIEPDHSYFLENGMFLETKLLFENNLENVPKNDCIKWFDYDKIITTLSLRTREQGDFLVIRDDGARKSLQDYLVNEKVPKSERDKQLLIADGNHILWVIGKRISAHYKVTEHTKRILEVYIGGKNRGRKN
ncbi:MAG: tRNA lysidine(34) synthetase TilS [Lachnospiraceae bacterium]|nr:tRNA lysidine(34) synthetase TilS [Lachnospiraceae bacterium]